MVQPEAFVLPEQRAQFEAAFRAGLSSAGRNGSSSNGSSNSGSICSSMRRNVWILKPADGSCGKGIRLVTDLGEVAAGEQGEHYGLDAAR